MDEGCAPDAGSARAFLALLERNASTKIVLSAWCPTMDIVVLVTADQQLQSFRLNWERLWSKQPATSITSIQWRPDGKQIAYGDEEGNVVVLAAEDGCEVERRRVFLGPSGAVVGLSWAVCGADARGGRSSRSSRSSRSTRLLGHHSDEHGFGACSGTDASSHTYCTPAAHNGHEVRSAWEARLARRGRDEDADLRMLCAVSAHGDVVVCGEGLLPMLAFRMFDRGQSSRVSNTVGQDVGAPGDDCVHTHGSISLRMASSAAQMWVGWRDVSGVHVVRMDTSVVKRHASMIRSVGSLLSDNLKDVGMMYVVVENIAAHLAEVEVAREEHLDNLRSILGGTRDPERDIYDVLVRGAYSMELKAFVGKAGLLKTAARRVDSAMSCLYHDIVYHLQPCLERIGFRLGDLRGHSLTLDGSSVLGLRPEAVGEAERWALDFVALAEHCRELALKAASGYRNFYALLSMLQHREMGETYPGLPKSAMEEVEELITARYYSAELNSIISSILTITGDAVDNQGVEGTRSEPADGAGALGRRGEGADERLLTAIFGSAASLHVLSDGSSIVDQHENVCGRSNASTNLATTPSYDRSAADLAAEDREEAAALEHLTLGIDRWLEGGSSMENVDALVEKKRAQLALRGEKAGLSSSLDVFKLLLLGIVECPARALSSHMRTTSHWNILSSGLGPSGARGSDDVGPHTDHPAGPGTGEQSRTDMDPFSMELDHEENLHIVAALDATFVHVVASPHEDALADVHVGRLPGGRRISSCAMYGKSDALILTAVSRYSNESDGSSGQASDGSLIAVVPLGDDTCPLHLKPTSLQSPIDDLIRGVGEVDASRCRIRHVPGLEIVAPFAASATRGVALALFSPVNSITIYDLEDDEEEEMEESASEDGSYDENVEMTD